jgi:hypothetical protein
MIAGLATGAPTFGIEADKFNNLQVFPVKHGEDLCVDPGIAKLFREATKNPLNPNGIGAGTWFMREQIRQSVSNPDWVSAGRDNEHYLGNAPIIGVMDKFGSIRGTEQDSAILQIKGLTDSMQRRWKVPVETLALPADALGIALNTNNFLTRWSSDDDKQQIAVIFTKMASTFDGEPVVWTKIKSNGNLPKDEILNDVMASLIAAGCAEISDRQWGSPRIRPANDLSAIFGGPVPVMHIHLNNERQILKSLLRMDAAYRKFGEYTMLSGLMRLKNVPNQELIFGHKLPDATQVDGIDPKQDANKPYFDIGREAKRDIEWFSLPERPTIARKPDNDNLRPSVAA